MADPVARDQPAGQFPIPARHQHDGAAVHDRRVQAVHHAGDVEHRHHAQADRLGAGKAPQCGADDVGHQGAVAVHAALGQTGCARGVRQDRQIVRLRGMRPGPMAGSKRIGPACARQSGSGVRQVGVSAQPLIESRRRRILRIDQRGITHRLAVPRHQQLLQPLVGWQLGVCSDHASRPVRRCRSSPWFAGH